MKRLDRPGRPTNRFLLAHKPATPSDFLFHLPEFIAIHGRLPVVLHSRVSSYEQARGLADIIEYLRYETRRYQLRIVGEVIRVVPGSQPFELRRDLMEAACIAREHGAFILSESTSRIIRSTAFHPSQNPDVLPTVPQFAKLMRDIGAPVVTALHPDLGRKATTRHERMVRSGFAERKPSEVRAMLKDQVKSMRVQGWGDRAIARELKLAESTLRGAAWS